MASCGSVVLVVGSVFLTVGIAGVWWLMWLCYRTEAQFRRAMLGMATDTDRELRAALARVGQSAAGASRPNHA